MKKGFLILLLFGIGTADAANSVCHKCVRVREENVRRAATEKQYDYYEDWLEEHHTLNQSKPDINFEKNKKKSD